MSEEQDTPRNDAAVGIAQIHQPRQSPETTEDFILCALERGTLDEVVKILRDWRSRKEVRKSLNKLHNRDPVDRFMHARRHAVEIYAKKHELTPARLMVSIVGEHGRKDSIGAERYKLRKAREYLKTDEIALAGAKSLASHWENGRGDKSDHGLYLKDITQGFTFP
jgi:hypothetical protein